MSKQEIPTDSDRRAAVALAEAMGIEEASQRSGWSQKSVAKWRNSAAYRAYAPAKVEFDEAQWADQLARTLKAVACLAAERELALAPHAELAIANKVRTTAVHDVQLLTGQATERSESVESTAAEAQTLADELAQRRVSKLA